jgi:hypothetical protein
MKEIKNIKWYLVACETVVRERAKRWEDYIKTQHYSTGITYMKSVSMYVTGSERFMKFINSK